MYWRNNKSHPNHEHSNNLVKEKKLAQTEGIICHYKQQRCEFKKFLFSGPSSTGKAIKFRAIKFWEWRDTVWCSHRNRMQGPVMQTERASDPVFAIKTSSRSALGRNPRLSYLSHVREALFAGTHKQHAQKTTGQWGPKGEQTLCCTTAWLLPYTARNSITLPKHSSHVEEISLSNTGQRRVNINTTQFAQHLFWRMH